MSTQTADTHQPRIYVLDFNRQARFYASWVHACGYAVEVLQDFRSDWEPPDDARLLVSAETYGEPSVSVLRRGVERNIPVLILADGILEYRNTWQNPTQVSGNLFQPVLGHKLACLGASQRRHVESWNNAGACEVVGFPAFDDLLALHHQRRDDGEFRLLIATAKRPYFDAAQREVVIAQLADLRRALAEWQRRVDRPTRVLWRLTSDLAAAIGLEDVDDEAGAGPLRELLPQCSAVIATPSTLILEAMLLDLPVAVLDYFNVPAYVPAAWHITAPQQMAATLDDLLQPPDARMRFQRVMLHDALECGSPSAPRMIELAKRMIAIGQECRVQGAQGELLFPARILPESADTPRVPVPFTAARGAGPEAPAVLLELRHLRKALADQHGFIESRRAELREHEQRLRAYDGHLEGVRLQLEELRRQMIRTRADLEAAQASVVRHVASRIAPARRLLMWGTGSHASLLCGQWPYLLEALTAFVDSAPARQGGEFLGKPILSPDALIAGADFVLIASSYANEIEALIQAKGLHPIDDYFAVRLLPAIPV